jgi:transcriptional regulator with XRE-family HTH domain
MTFAEQLRAARKRLGLTQAELATLLGVSFEGVSKWERGLSEPSRITQEGALARLKRHKKRK